MKVFFTFFIFCLVLFLYLHIQFHLKTSEDLEMYEIDFPSKDRLEEICDIRQPVLFDFENQSKNGLLTTSINWRIHLNKDLIPERPVSAHRAKSKG